VLRGSIILFTAALSKIFLGRKLFRYHYVGLAIVTAGLATVGTSSLLDETGSQKSLALGIFFIVLGQFCNAVQMVFEEKFLKSRNLAPLFVVGMEGVWGVLIMACGVLPVMQHVHGSDKGSYENASDALRMISQNHSLLAYCLIYLASIAFYNFFGLSVAKSLTSVHRSLIDALRTILVWSVSLFIYYVISERLGGGFLRRRRRRQQQQPVCSPGSAQSPGIGTHRCSWRVSPCSSRAR
jgi:drug/metabolite transporter (DMT)-like permease